MSSETDQTIAPAAPSGVQTIPVGHGHVLELEQGPGDNVLRILTPDGKAGLSITIGPDGIRVDVRGGDLSLHAEGALSIDADRLALRGRSGVSIESDGDASLKVAGDLHSEARIQNIRARLGNVNVQANDDVKLNGERIRLNT